MPEEAVLGQPEILGGGIEGLVLAVLKASEGLSTVRGEWERNGAERGKPWSMSSLGKVCILGGSQKQT